MTATSATPRRPRPAPEPELLDAAERMPVDEDSRERPAGATPWARDRA